MKIKNLEKYLFSFCILLAVFHTPYIATFTNFFPNYESTSIAYNVKILIISIVLIIIALSKKIILPKIYILIILIFLTTFIVSYFALASNNEYELNHSLTYYYGHALVNIAMLTLIFCKYEKIKNFEKLFLFLLILFVFLILLNDQSSIYGQGRLRYASYNPISMGHMGCMLALISLSSLISWRNKFISLISLCLGLWLLREADSRGPIVAFLISFLFLLYFKNYRVIFFSSLLIILYFFVNILITDEIILKGRLFDTDNITILIRLELYSMYIEEIKNNIILPNVNPIYSLKYSHNILLAVYSGASIFGLLILLYIIIKTINHSIKIIKYHNQFTWISLVFIQMLVGSMFSGGLINLNFWIFTSLVNACYYKINNENKFKNE